MEIKYSEPYLTCPECEVEFEDKPPIPPVLRKLVIFAFIIFCFAVWNIIGFVLSNLNENQPYYQLLNYLTWAAFLLMPVFVFWFLTAHHWKRRCPECGKKFVIPGGRRTGHYSYSPLYYPFVFVGKAFPTLVSPTEETKKQSVFITALCAATIALTLIGFNLMNEWLGPKIFGPTEIDAYVLPYILHWHTTFFICLALIIIVGIGYGFRRYAITPFLMLLVLICVEVICAFILIFPVFPHKIMTSIDDDTAQGWREFGEGNRPEYKIFFALNDPGKSVEHRNALVDYLEKHLRPWMKKHIKKLSQTDGDKEIRARLKNLIGKVERLNE